MNAASTCLEVHRIEYLQLIGNARLALVTHRVPYLIEEEGQRRVEAERIKYTKRTEMSVRAGIGRR